MCCDAAGTSDLAFRVLSAFIGDRVGGLSRAQVLELRNQLRGTLDRLNALQAQVALASDKRDRQIEGIQEFAVKFRAAVVAQYGPQSTQAKRVPRVETGSRRRSAPTPPPEAP